MQRTYGGVSYVSTEGTCQVSFVGADSALSCELQRGTAACWLTRGGLEGTAWGEGRCCKCHEEGWWEV